MKCSLLLTFFFLNDLQYAMLDYLEDAHNLAPTDSIFMTTMNLLKPRGKKEGSKGFFKKADQSIKNKKKIGENSQCI